MDENAVDIVASDDEEEGRGAPGWMVTFGDMMSLLLCFFVLLLSYSTMDMKKFQMILKSIRVGFGQMSSTAIIQPNVPEFGDDRNERSKTDADSQQLAMKLEEIIDDADISSAVEVTREEAGILLRVRGHVVFEPGRAEIRPESLPFLTRLAGLLREFPLYVLIRGHTDDSAVPRDGPFPSNWELSSARASSVVRVLIQRGGLDPMRFAAVGFADTRPIVPNDSPENRSINRRVEFVLVNQESGAAREGITIF